MNRCVVAVIAFTNGVFANAEAEAVEVLSAEELASRCAVFQDTRCGLRIPATSPPLRKFLNGKR